MDTRQPSRQEAEKYYVGLPSQPLLIARSSTTPWNGARYYKSLIPVGHHDALATVWGDASPLKSRIISCLDGKAIQWRSFYPIKIGDFEDRHTQSLVLLISVDAEHMPQWNVAQEVVDQCTDILREFGIDNLECEMVATSWFTLTNPEAPAKLEALNSKKAKTLDEDFSKFMPFPGAAIDSADNARNEQLGYGGSTGSLGLTVRITKRPTERWLSKWHSMTEQERAERSPELIETEDCSFIAALTCNHCVQSGSKSLLEFDPDTMRYDVHLPSGKYLHKRIEELEESITKESKKVDQYKDTLREAGWSNSEENQAGEKECPDRRTRAAKMNAEAIIGIHGRARDYIRPFESLSVRTLGRVFYTPPIGLDEASKAISDWALLDIFEDKVEAGHQWNLVPLFWGDVVGKGMATLKAVDPTLDEKSSMQLQSSIIPKSEFRRGMVGHDSLSSNPESRQYVLGKYGAATGLTFGYCNDYKAVTRNPTSEGPTHISEEYFIVALPNDGNRRMPSYFSERGDSGSVVWNLDGRPVGMLTSGEGSDLGISVDVTYMTLFEDVFGMMADRGFGVSIVE